MNYRRLTYWLSGYVLTMEIHSTVSVTINQILNILRDTCKKTWKVASRNIYFNDFRGVPCPLSSFFIFTLSESESNRISTLYQQFICPFRNVTVCCRRRSLQQNEHWLQKAKLIKPNFRCGGRAQWAMSFQRILYPPFYRKPVAQLFIRAHSLVRYSLYHFDSNLKFQRKNWPACFRCNVTLRV